MFYGTTAIRVTLLLIAILSMSGCDKYTKHEVLTFFFTGVPSLEEEEALSDGKQTKGPGYIRKKKKAPPPVLTSFLHGPYDAKLCTECHTQSSGKGFKSFGGTQSSKSSSSFQGMIGGVKASQELCTDCHMNKSTENIKNRGLFAHKPVSDGMCTKCHNPHQSQFRYMLLREKSQDLCIQCHFNGDAALSERHSNKKECILCHNAHAGKNRFLLRKDFNEIF